MRKAEMLINIILVVLILIFLLIQHLYYHEVFDRLINLENMVQEEIVDGVVTSRYLPKTKQKSKN